MPYYRIKSAIERGSKIRTLERELRTLESKLNEREISEEDRKEIEKRHAELIKKKESEKERGHVLPDPVKDASEPVMYATNLAKEIANAANHLLLNEIKRNVSEKEFDKLYGEIVYERDPFKRYLTIKGYVKENKIHINDEINKDAEKIISKVIKNLKELDDFVGTREEIYDQIKAVDKLVAKAREIVGDPVKYGLLIVDQDDQLRRYIELSDFVDEEVLKECKNNGLEAGLKLLKSKNNIEDYKKIMETHAAFVKGGVRSRGRIEDIKKDMVWFMIRQREFKHLISVLENKGMLTGKMSQEKLEKLSRYFAREMSYIDSIEIETLKEREKRTDKIKEITASALVQIGREEGRLGENVSKQDIIEEMNKIAGTTISNEDKVMISKEMENEEILIDAIKEWAHERAFDRATGITKLNGFEKDIIYLANKTESEINAYRLLIKRADDFNGQKKRNAIIVINERLGGIVKDVDTKKSEDILLEMDARVREVLYNSLVEFYKKVSEEGETYREYFVKKTIGGKEHLLIKGHVDPTKKDVVKLVKMFNKEFPHKKRDLLKIVRDELVKRNVGKEDAEKIAPNYLGFYDELSSYAILHPGLDLPYDAANQFVWIYESKSVYKAVPEEMPPYETMGPADTLVNYGIVKRKVKHELRSGEEIEEEVSLLRPVTGKWQDRVRKVANWIEIQGNELLGAYIGVMSEEVATHVIYTRHGEFIRKLGEFHKGSGTFAEDVMRNPGLCNKLIELYKARVVLPRVNKLNEKDREKLMNVLNLDGIKKGIIEELKKIEDKARKDGKVSEANYIEENVIRSIEELNFSSVDNIDKAIGLCEPYAGEYLMQEGLNDLIVKSYYNRTENMEKIDMIGKDIKFIKNVLRETSVKVSKIIEGLEIDKNDKTGLLSTAEQIKDPTKSSTSLNAIMHKLMDIESKAATDDAKARIKNAITLLDDYGKRITTLSGRYNELLEDEAVLKANIFIAECIQGPRFWKTRVTAKYAKEFFVKLVELKKNDAHNADANMSLSGTRSRNSLVREVFEYSNKVKGKRQKMSELEKSVNERLRNISFITDQFLNYTYAQYSTLNAGMHSRMKGFGLEWQSTAGVQFVGPIASSLMQRLATYGAYSNKGWLTSIFLSYPIMKAQQIYKRRYPILHKISQIPSVYEPMKRRNINMVSFMEAFLYRRWKSKIARMGEILRATASDMPPRAYVPYLLTSNPFGETRVSEALEVFGNAFRSTPKGPRDILNYMLYKPNDLVMDFKDFIYTLKEGRSMKKTPEHLMDVGIYGVAANTGFIAGREIKFIETALGGASSFYPNRAFNAYYSQPHLAIPSFMYPAYGDIYKRTQKPTQVATEMIYLTDLSESTIISPLYVMPAMILIPSMFSSVYSAYAQASGFTTFATSWNNWSRVIGAFMISMPVLYYSGRNVLAKMYELGMSIKDADFEINKRIMDKVASHYYKSMYHGEREEGQNE
ncbi:MAG: hypothetical protein ACP5KJ_01925 [Candidatus Micrarchaeia archaeon]